MSDLDAPVSISDWMIAAGLAVMETRLAGGLVGVQLAAMTHTPPDALQCLIVLAREIGQSLRPQGHPGGPIGLNTDPFALNSILAVDQRTAAVLIGSAAQGDYETVVALALAVARDTWGCTRARAVARYMLIIYGDTPIVPAPPHPEESAP